MKKSRILVAVLVGLLMASGFIMAGCAELDAFVDGYNYGRSLSYKPDHPFKYYENQQNKQ
jgi:hypothetical protein